MSDKIDQTVNDDNLSCTTLKNESILPISDLNIEDVNQKLYYDEQILSKKINFS